MLSTYKRGFNLVALSNFTSRTEYLDDLRDMMKIIRYNDNHKVNNVVLVSSSSKTFIDELIHEQPTLTMIMECDTESLSDIEKRLGELDRTIEYVFVVILHPKSSETIDEIVKSNYCNNVILSARNVIDMKYSFPYAPYILYENYTEITNPIDNLIIFSRKNKEEYQYLNLIKKILSEGKRKSNRTGVDTLSIFGNMMRFSLKDGRIPVLTTKRTFWKGIVEELLWFLRGETSSESLSKRGVKIWNPHGTREALDLRGLRNREVGDLGPVYGFQWRHFGADYIDCHTDYTGQGVDQIQMILQTLKTDPNSRRMVLTAWNPTVLHEMALPPCHIMAIFNVTDGCLNCMVTQRSADVGLGVPFNIASYSLLVFIMSHLSGIPPGELVYTTADTHIYENHVQQLEIQSQRTPEPFPFIRINARTDVKPEDIHCEDIVLLDYVPCESLPMPVAV